MKGAPKRKIRRYIEAGATNKSRREILAGEAASTPHELLQPRTFLRRGDRLSAITPAACFDDDNLYKKTARRNEYEKTSSSNSTGGATTTVLLTLSSLTP